MESNIMKNIVILKNLPSNLVEEAFVVLKENEKIQIEDLTNKESTARDINKNTNEKESKEYIVKEAELLVENYLKDIEKRKNEKSKDIWKLKYEKLKILNIFLVFLFAIVIIKSFI